MVIDVMSQPPAIAGHGYWDDTFVKTPGWLADYHADLVGKWPYLQRPHIGGGGNWGARAFFEKL